MSTKPDCDELHGLLTAYCDDELTESDCRRIRAHMAECETCSEEYHSDIALKSLVRRSCQCEPAPASLRMSIMTRISSTTYYVREG